jgi:hypothetical protein
LVPGPLHLLTPLLLLQPLRLLLLLLCLSQHNHQLLLLLLLLPPAGGALVPLSATAGGQQTGSWQVSQGNAAAAAVEQGRCFALTSPSARLPSNQL